MTSVPPNDRRGSDPSPNRRRRDVPDRCATGEPHVHLVTDGRGTRDVDCDGADLVPGDPRIAAARSAASAALVRVALEALDDSLGARVRRFFTTDELMAYVSMWSRQDREST